MAEVASLALRVDSVQILAGKAALDKLSVAGKRAAVGATRLRTRFAQLATTTKGLAASMLSLKAAIPFVVFAAAIRSGAKFSQSIADLSAITGATGKDLKFLSDAAKEYGETTTLSASQVAEAFKLVASAKPDLLANLPALKAVTQQTILLAEAASIDVPAAANVLGSALNQFQEGASEAARFINVLAAGAKFGASEIEQTAVAIAKSGVVAKSVGIEFEELNAAIQILAANGQKAEIAGTGLRGVLIKLATQSNNEFNPAMVGLEQAFRNLSTASLTARQQSKLFGLEGIVVAQILTNNANKLGTMTEKLTGTNTAMEQATIKVDTLTGDWKKFMSVLEGMGIFVGETFNPVIRGLLQTLTELIGAAKWAAEVFTVFLTGGLQQLAKGFILAKNGALLFLDAITFGGEKDTIISNMLIEMEAINNLIDENIKKTEVLLGMRVPEEDAIVTGSAMDALAKVLEEKAAKQRAARAEELAEQIAFQGEINAAAAELIAKEDAELEERKRKKLEFHAALQAAAKKQIAEEDAAIAKRVAAEKQANATILGMKMQNYNQIAGIIKMGAGTNKAALLAALAIETALAVARIEINTQAAAMAARAGDPSGTLSLSIIAQGAMARTLALSAAAIGAAGIIGQAHDGLSTVPRTGTFLLEKGERVVKKEDNKLLTKALESGRLGGVTIVVQVDATGSANVEEVTLRAAEEGARRGYELVANDIKRGGPIRSAIG